AEELAAATHRPVLYPTRIQLSGEAKGLMIDQPVPMRADQETIYLGRGPAPQQQTVTIAGTLAGRSVTQSWKLPAVAGENGNTFLYGFYRQAVRDGGLTPLAGMGM